RVSGFGADAIGARLASADAAVRIATTGFSRRGKRVDVEGAVRESLQRLPTVRRVVWKRTGDEPLRSAGDIDWHEVARSCAGQGQAPAIMGPDDPFMVIYTSGTTGKPKGV